MVESSNMNMRAVPTAKAVPLWALLSFSKSGSAPCTVQAMRNAFALPPLIGLLFSNCKQSGHDDSIRHRPHLCHG